MEKKKSALVRVRAELKETQALANQLIDQRDGLQMTVQAHEAKIHGLQKQLELLKKSGNAQHAKAEAWREIAYDTIEQLKQKSEVTNVCADESESE
jgi:hypothetical protein